MVQAYSLEAHAAADRDLFGVAHAIPLHQVNYRANLEEMGIRERAQHRRGQWHPDRISEYRDRGLIFNALECYNAALTDLHYYLNHAPEDEDVGEVRQLVFRLQEHPSAAAGVVDCHDRACSSKNRGEPVRLPLHL